MSGYTPKRKCAGCMQVKDKEQMLRIVRTPDGVQLDSTGHAPGRGVYLCSGVCVQLALKKKRLSRNLRCEVPVIIYEQAEKFFDRE